MSARLGGLPLRVHRPFGLLVAAAIALGLALALGGGRAIAADLATAWERRDRASRWVAVAASLATLVVGLAWGTWAASGADASGYVSQAVMWASGQWRIEQPLATQVPWPDAGWTFSPLGYRPAVRPGAMVPTYPPGLPLSMAPFVAAAGPAGAFLVVPFLGGLAVWLAFLAGRRVSGPTAGAVAAVALAASPAFLYQVVQPMSDVPVTAWWLAALVFAMAGRPATSGLAAGAALLTRPNLAPLAVVLAVGVAAESLGHRASVRAALAASARFSVALLPAVAVLLLLDQAWYGHPFESGYGQVSGLFAWRNLRPNLARYPRWLLETQSPFILAGLALPVVAWWGQRRNGGGRGAAVGRAIFGVLFIVSVLACYLFYAPFEEWWYLRFLLPAVAVALVLAAAVAVVVIERLPVAARVPVLVLATVALASGCLRTAMDRRAFDLRDLEHRYVTAGDFAARHLPPQSVLLAVQESGSLRHYSGRVTLRWDLLDPAWLDRALADLASRGRTPYLVLEAWEETAFRDRFWHASEFGRLDWPPAAEVGGAVRVRVYDPRDRARFLSGQPIRPLRPSGG